MYNRVADFPDCPNCGCILYPSYIEYLVATKHEGWKSKKEISYFYCVKCGHKEFPDEKEGLLFQMY